MRHRRPRRIIRVVPMKAPAKKRKPVRSPSRKREKVPAK